MGFNMVMYYKRHYKVHNIFLEKQLITTKNKGKSDIIKNSLFECNYLPQCYSHQVIIQCKLIQSQSNDPFLRI